MDNDEDDALESPFAKVKYEYELAASMASMDLERLNRRRPESMRYCSVRELVRDYLGRAAAVSEFAQSLGLISSEEATHIIKSISAEHPEINRLFDGNSGEAKPPDPTAD